MDFAANEFGFAYKARSKKKRLFRISASVKILENIMPNLPQKSESFRAISYEGGFSSISFISSVGKKEKILELTVSTLRVGERQFMVLRYMREHNMLEHANFIIGGIMKVEQQREKAKGKESDDNLTRFVDGCSRFGWKYASVNNHSKIILMRTANNFYVLETSSNLNENPKIEQYIFENDKTLYEFYYTVLMELLNGDEPLDSSIKEEPADIAADALTKQASSVGSPQKGGICVPKATKYKITKTREQMKKLGVYKPEYETAIAIYSGLVEQYNILLKQFIDGGYAVDIDCGFGESKKTNPIIRVMETLRKDILQYSDRLGLNPKAMEAMTVETPALNKLAGLFGDSPVDGDTS